MLLYAPTKRGKTTLAAGLDDITQTYENKRSLFIAIENADGGGTMSIQDKGIPFVQPIDLSQTEAILAALATDTTYGGIVFDNASDFVKNFVQPYALKFPSREKAASRAAGVPERSDYQTMGEKARQIFNQLVNLTKLPIKYRKHVIVIAHEREKQDNSGILIAIQPDLPGAMSEGASAMFQTVATMAIRRKLEQIDGKAVPVITRVLVTEADGVRRCEDRMKVFPKESPADLVQIYTNFWLPKVAANAEARKARQPSA